MHLKAPLCSCKRKATHVCLNHSIYICEIDRFKHNCNIIDLQNFSKNTRLNKLNFVKKLKKLKTEHKQNRQELTNINRESIAELKALGQNVKGMVDRVISLLCKAGDQLISTKLAQGIEKTEKLLNGWEAKKDYIAIDSFLREKPFGKLRKEERDKFTKYKKELRDSRLVSDVRLLMLELKASLGVSIKAFSAIKVIESDDKFSKRGIIRHNTDFSIDERYFANKKSFSKASFAKHKRKRCNSFVPLGSTPNKYFTNKNDYRVKNIENYMSNVNNGKVMTPLDSTFVNNIKKSALDKIKQSGMSVESDSLKSFDPNKIKLFDQSISIVDEGEQDSFVKLQEKALFDGLEEIREKLGNKVYFNQFNKAEITQDMESFMLKFKADFNRLIQSWNFK